MRAILEVPSRCQGHLWEFRNLGYTYPLHRHTELEVNFVLRGTARYLVGGQRYDLRPGTLIWLFPEQEHALLHQSPDHHMWIGIFTPDLLQHSCRTPETEVLLQGNPSGSFCRQIAPATARGLLRLFQDVAVQVDQADRYNAGLAYLLLSAWSAHVETAPGMSSSEVHPAVALAARHLREQREALAMEELAERCGLSLSRLTRLFRKQLGMTMVAYRQRQCLDRFLRSYGRDPEKKILSTALDSGFGSYPQFYRVFRQYMKTTPAQYRRQGDDEI